MINLFFVKNILSLQFTSKGKTAKIIQHVMCISAEKAIMCMYSNSHIKAIIQVGI